MLKAIMYHYVLPFNEELPFFKKLDIADFGKQLDYFEQEFGFVTKNEFINSFQTGNLPNGIILTFDDGLKCHYEHVYKELKKRNLWAIFYITTAPYKSNKLLDVHRIHLLLGKYSGKQVYNEMKNFIIEEMLTDKLITEFQELTYELQENDNYTQLVKRILNYYISYEFREKVIDELMKKMIPNELSSIENFYLSEDEISEMSAEMIIGSHSISHPVMSKLNLNEQKKEIKESFNFLNTLKCDLSVKTFCYPYGGFHTFTSQTEELLNNENCLFSFNVEHREISFDDVMNRPQALPRYDCNVFPYGKCR